MPDIISVIIALVLVIVAAVHDLREFRIPNRLIVAGIVAGVSVIVIRAFTGEYRKLYSWNSGGISGNDISIYNQGCRCRRCKAFGSNWNVDRIGFCTAAYGGISYYRAFYGNC